MTCALSLRLRMILLFCVVVGVWLAASNLAFYAVLSRIIQTQFDRRLREAASPLVADLITDQDEEDVKELNLPDEYFELLDGSGHVLATSKNWQGRSLDPAARGINLSETTFQTLDDLHLGRLRQVLIPFRRGTEGRILALAIPTRDQDQALKSFRRVFFWLLPLSILLTAAVSTWYVGRSLRPITELTRQTASMAEEIQTASADALERRLRTSLPVSSPDDEVGQLAATFNQLFIHIDAGLRQLRQFVSDASHELRTPLSVLQGETELLLSEPRTVEEYQKALEVMEGELKKLSRIVEGLFTLAMADAGQFRLATEPLYLNEVLEETCTRVIPRAQQKNIAIDRELKQEVSYVGDDAFLRQLFLIFLENAIKYSPSNTRVRVTLEQSNGTVRVKFQDQGIGIPSEHLPHIFERFYRAAPPENGESQSGGLGLAIAQAIVRAHGGSIECESTPGAGSSFTVELPLNKSL